MTLATRKFLDRAHAYRVSRAKIELGIVAAVAVLLLLAAWVSGR